MSGVNAHVLLQASRNTSAAITVTSLHWQKLRLYALPRQLSMSGTYIPLSKQQARFCCPTAVAGLSWLWEVAAAGRQILNPTAAIECAASAVRQCYEESSFCLSHMSLEATSGLPDTIYTNLDLRTGELRMESEASTPILSCSASSVAVRPAIQPPASSSPLHSALPSGRRSTYSSLAASPNAGVCVVDPGNSTAALHLSMLGSPTAKMISTIQTVTVPDCRPTSEGQKALSTDSSATVLSPAGQRVAFEDMLLEPLSREAANLFSAPDVLYTIDWLVDNAQAAPPPQGMHYH